MPPISNTSFYATIDLEKGELINTICISDAEIARYLNLFGY